MITGLWRYIMTYCPKFFDRSMSEMARLGRISEDERDYMSGIAHTVRFCGQDGEIHIIDPEHPEMLCQVGQFVVC